VRARSHLRAHSSQRDTHNSNDSWGGSYYSDPAWRTSSTQWDHSRFTGGRSEANEQQTSSDPRRDWRNGQRSQATTSTAELSSAVRSSVDEWGNGGNESDDNGW
jgi:hypothetical protein